MYSYFQLKAVVEESRLTLEKITENNGNYLVNVSYIPVEHKVDHRHMYVGTKSSFTALTAYNN